MINEKYSFSDFIEEKMFLNLASCIMLVCGSVELFKQFTEISPLWLNLIISGIVTVIRIAIVGNFSFKGILIGLMNLVPILLGATGAYEFLKNGLG